MTPIELFETIYSVITNQNFIFKIVFSILCATYGLFALIVARQIFLLSQIFSQNISSGTLKLLSIINIGISFILLILTISIV